MSDSSGDSPWVDLRDRHEDYSFAGGRFRLLRSMLRYRRRDGEWSEVIERISFERGDSIAVLLFDPDEDYVVLVRQFRYPVFESLPGSSRSGQGPRGAWVIETVAGMLEGENPPLILEAQREVLEEAGYEIHGGLDHIMTVFASPGGTSEKLHIYLGRVDRHVRAGEGGGRPSEGEDIEVVALPAAAALGMVHDGTIADAKTVLALQYLALEGFVEWRPDGSDGPGDSRD